MRAGHKPKPFELSDFAKGNMAAYWRAQGSVGDLSKIKERTD